MSGECMVTLNAADSMLGRELWRNILDKLPLKPGRQLVLSHNTSKLVLHESLQHQGLRGQRAQVSATYIPVNLLAALRFAHERHVEDEEFTLNGITEILGVGHRMPALLHNLPKSLRTLLFAHDFNQEIHDVRLPALRDVTLPEGLQNLTFGDNFDQSLDNVRWPAGLQSLNFGQRFNQSLDYVTWPPGLQTLTFCDRSNDCGEFNQSLDNVKWPESLQTLTFKTYFNQSLDNVTWPEHLQNLTFGDTNYTRSKSRHLSIYRECT